MVRLLKFEVFIRYLFLSTCLSIWSFISISAAVQDLTKKELSTPPPRIIRTCCSFGVDMRVVMVPIKKITDITSLSEIGPHKYLGSKDEGNGIIYTRRGGFVDLGHLRDQADWTTYLYLLIQTNKNTGHITQELGYEGGTKVLNIDIPSDIDSTDIISLAGRIAYDLSVWHEIATWFGTSYVPLVPERYSSFSIEDIYSNLLGVTLGMQALKSKEPYEQAMTGLIASIMDTLQAVSTLEETYRAMEAVENIWWTRDKRLPSRKVLLEHDINAYQQVEPWMVPDWSDKTSPYVLSISDTTRNGILLSDLYKLNFKLNFKFPVKELFPLQDKRVITQQDFDTLLQHVEQDIILQEIKNQKELTKRYVKKTNQKKRKQKSTRRERVT